MGIKADGSNFLAAKSTEVGDLGTPGGTVDRWVSFWIYSTGSNPWGQTNTVVGRFWDQLSPEKNTYTINVRQDEKIQSRLGYSTTSAQNTTTPTLTWAAGWYHILLSISAAANDHRIYRDGTNEKTGSWRDINAVKPGVALLAYARDDSAPPTVTNICESGIIVAEIAEWWGSGIGHIPSEMLTGLANGYSPLFWKENLDWYAQLRELDSGGDVRADWGGFRFTQYGGGALAVDDHPPMRYPRRKAQILVPAAAGGGATITLGVLEGEGALNSPTLSPGAVTTSLGVLEAVATLNPPGISSGPVTTSLGVLSAVAELLDLTPAPGAVSLPLGVLEGLGELPPPSVTPGGVSVPLGLLEGIGEVRDPTLAPGGVSVPLSVCEGEGALLDPTVVAGAVGVPLASLSGLAELLDPTLSSGTVLSLGLLSGRGELLTPTLTPGAISVPLAVLAGDGSLPDPVLAPGVATVPLPALEGLGTLQDPILVAGAASVSLGVLQGLGELLGPTVSPGAVVLALPALEAEGALNSPQFSSIAVLSLPALEGVGSLNDLSLFDIVVVSDRTVLVDFLSALKAAGVAVVSAEVVRPEPGHEVLIARPAVEIEV